MAKYCIEMGYLQSIENKLLVEPPIGGFLCICYLKDNESDELLCQLEGRLSFVVYLSDSLDRSLLS
jgi:hypothetical protein